MQGVLKLLLSSGQAEDPFRKPKPGMWQILEQHFNSGISSDMDQQSVLNFMSQRNTLVFEQGTLTSKLCCPSAPNFRKRNLYRNKYFLFLARRFCCNIVTCSLIVQFSLEHLQRSCFALAGGGLGPAIGSSAQQQDKAVDGLHKPGRAQRQILPGFVDVIDDVSTEKNKEKI
ncbi:polynucleotide 3-phosphatase ZDP [Prunus yedoensis var. nudiflora]|uniref:Polynucleotide 3-phosphatase ZDP n=1 Tax=Prunus yedoensis var. nudiflora TaxID=2094558 RepID=A0A314U7J1_PRUYE|nr:polynucleotide 3-phosphatase ZDP [Prunus yedoensis var. nudiflora]